jgi:hypothetical protein
MLSVAANATDVNDGADSSPSRDEENKARALIAEVDAKQLDQQGQLFKEYKIAFRTESGDVQYRAHQAPRVDSDLQVRQASSYWLAKMGKQYPGNNPFGTDNRNYEVFRNVKDYGTRGDGRTDDTDAINKAISDGNHCGEECGGSTVKSATVYFPPGTYLVSTPIISYFHTQLVGDVSIDKYTLAHRTCRLGQLTIP